MIERFFLRLVRHLDGFLLGALTLTLLLGLFVLYSASGENPDRVLAQSTNMLIALGVMWLAANIPPQHLERSALPLYVVGVALLLGVAFFGEISNGARRWLDLGVVRIQPSEIIKIAVPMMLAWYFAKREATLRFGDYIVAAVMLILPVTLILKQPDLGTAVMIFGSGIYVIYLAGFSWKLIIAIALGGMALMPLAWNFLHEYQRRRIEILFDPQQDPLGSGYHTIQASIAIGSGGLGGKGWLNGTQSQLDFIPERTTDFILAVFGEEFGLLGNLLLLLLFTLIIGRGMVIAAQAQTTFSRLLAGSITLTFFTYAFVNMGMVSGVLPVVGVPLPLISYGGTSLVTLLLGFGILMSIQSHKKLVAS